MNHFKRYSRALARVMSLAALFASLATTATAATERLLHTFNATNHTDGSGPQGNLVADSAGNLYGTAFGSGSRGFGLVYQLSPPVSPGGKWSETIIYDFSGPDGANPASAMIFDSAGNLYGTTAYGGNGPCTAVAVVIGCGVVFELSPPGTPGGSWTESVLYQFQFAGDSGGPRAPLVFDTAGNLYGTASGSGFDTSFNNAGTVFELSPPALPGGAWTETTLTNFPAASLGIYPFAPVVFDASGNLYGTTYSGGTGSCILGCGVVFKLAPPSVPGGSWTITILHNFLGGTIDGSNSAAGLAIDPSGSLFGTTSKGGSSFDAGTVFAMRPPATLGGAWTYATIRAFGGIVDKTTDGAASRAGVTFGPGRVLYGTTSAGGFFGNGIVFQLTPPVDGVGPWTEDVLYAFQYSSKSFDGNSPYGGVILRGGKLVGTTLGGGSKNSGTVYAIAP